jgi:predicted metal-dependent RNase
MLPDWLDSQFGKMLATVIPASAIGTLWRSIITPRQNIVDVAKGAILSITVGALVGGGVMQYFKLEGFVAAGVVATVAYLAEHTLALFDKRGAALKKGKVDISLNGDAE